MQTEEREQEEEEKVAKEEQKVAKNKLSKQIVIIINDCEQISCPNGSSNR